MPTLNPHSCAPGNTMVVDDNPANLKLLEEMLVRHAYEVRSFPRGRLAVTAAQQQPPDLILLDIDMPELDGYEVCAELKADERCREIPVIFLSALAYAEDKVKGFHTGAVDFISKPFQFEEVRARVETHLSLTRPLRAEHDSLERTLGGAVAMLLELVQLAAPMLAVRSEAIRGIVGQVAGHVGVNNMWECELAARMCLVGCVVLPEDVFERGYRGDALPPEEARLFRGHPERAAGWIARIPRLENVAELVKRQHLPRFDPADSGPVQQGSQLLHLAMEADRRLYRGASVVQVVEELARLHRFDRGMLEGLQTYRAGPERFECRPVGVRELRAGMVLDGDVLSNEGNCLILAKDTVLSETWIERLQNFAHRGALRPTLVVRIPMIASATGRAPMKETLWQ